MEENTHTVRLAVVLFGIVAMLFVAVLGTFTDKQADDQQASVLRAYAK